ncbi:hypothetical protein R84981_002834 [Carnimonas sp. R-84981]
MMLGYTTKKKAKQQGFEHYVKIFGVVPAYARNLYECTPEVMCSHPFLEAADRYLVTPICILLQQLRGDQPGFYFKVVHEL